MKKYMIWHIADKQFGRVTATRLIWMARGWFGRVRCRSLENEAMYNCGEGYECYYSLGILKRVGISLCVATWICFERPTQKTVKVCVHIREREGDREIVERERQISIIQFNTIILLSVHIETSDKQISLYGI